MLCVGIICSPIIVVYMLFDFIRVKLYKQCVYVPIKREGTLIKYRKDVKKEYGYAVFVKKHVVESEYCEHNMGPDVLVGVTFYFYKPEDAVHFKLLNLPE